MKLVVGLGNPGREYVSTRHNIGFEVIDHLAQMFGWCGPDDFDRLARSKFESLTLDGPVTLPDGTTEKALLIKPLTFMNLSGRAVQAAMAFYQLLPTDVLVVLDDIALPCGKIRLRSGGSSGGHNGLKDIERALATPSYPRLRIGIDLPGRVPQRDYVLGRFSPDQRKRVNPAVERAGNATLVWMNKGIAAAMNTFNADEAKETSGS